MQVQTVPDSTERSVRKLNFLVTSGQGEVFERQNCHQVRTKRLGYENICSPTPFWFHQSLLAPGISPCSFHSSLCFPSVRLGFSPCFFHPSLFPRSLPAPAIPPCSFHSSLLSLRIPEFRTYSSHLVSPKQIANKWSTTPVRNQNNCNQAVFGKKPVTGKRCSNLHEWYSKVNSSGYFENRLHSQVVRDDDYITLADFNSNTTFSLGATCG